MSSNNTKQQFTTYFEIFQTTTNNIRNPQMNNRDLKHIIQQIKAGEGLKLTQIATRAEIDRSYLSKVINSESIEEMEDSYVGKIAKAFPGYFNKQHKTTDQRIDKILANLDELRDYTVAILTAQTAGQEVIMGSLDRLEENEEGTLSAIADKLALKFSERLEKIQKDRKADART